MTLGATGGNDMTVRIPFYGQYMDLPSRLAQSPQAYCNLILFRFFKELPVIAASALTLTMFGKLMLLYSRGEMRSKRTKRCIMVIVIALTAALLLFNLLGLPEVEMLNSTFNGVYGSVWYTVAIRAKCEPLLYALYVYIFSLLAGAREVSTEE